MYAGEKTGIKDVPEKRNGITYPNKPAIINSSAQTPLKINDTLYQSDFTKSTATMLNKGVANNAYNYMTYSITGNTFSMSRTIAGDTNDKIYNACGAIFLNTIPDTVTTIHFNITVDNISADNDFQVQILTGDTTSSHYLKKGVNIFDIQKFKTQFKSFQIVSFGIKGYGSEIPHSIVISNITVTVAKLK